MHPASWLVLAIIVTALVLGWTRRLPAFGVLAVANVLIHFVAFAARDVPVRIRGEVEQVSVVTMDLGLWTRDLVEPQAWVQWLGHMFLHASFGHLLGNMLILAVIGYYLEERSGPRTVVAAYVLTGFVAAATEIARQWGNDVVMVGASGADFGLIGVLAAAYPQHRVRIPVPVFIIVFIPMRAWVAAIVFAVLQFFFLTAFPTYGTAYFAHLGGLAGGILLGWTVLRNRTPRAARQEDWAAFAATGPARDAWEHMQGAEDEPEVRDAWRERFLERARCPRCGTPPVVQGRKLRCPHCGFEGS